MEQVDWGSGFHLPIANDENKKLEAELKSLFIQKSKAKFSYDNALAQSEQITKHLAYIQQEAEQFQKLITTHNREINDEKQKLKTLQASKDKVKQEIRSMNKIIQDLQDVLNLKQTDLSRNVLKLEKLKAETAWDVEALEAWEASLRRRNEDNDLLKKFSREDDSRASKIEAKRKNLQMEVNNRRTLLDKTLIEVASYEQVIEKGGNIFRQQIEEKFSLIERWQEAVKNLYQRDEDINKTNREMNIVKETIMKQEEALEEQSVFLNNEKNNNKSIEEEIEHLNSISSAKRKELNQIVQLSLNLTGQINRLKRITQTSSYQQEKERKTRRILDKELSKLEFRTRRTEYEIHEVQSKLQEIDSSKASTEDRLKRLEQIRLATHKSTDTLISDTEKMQYALHKAQIQLKHEKDMAKVNEMKISGCDISIKLLTKQIKQIMDRIALHKDIAQALDCKISELEIKIAQLEFQGKNEDLSIAANAKICELEQTLQEHVEVKNFLQIQVAHSQEKIRQLRAAVTYESSQLEVLRGKLQEQMLLVEGGNRQITAAKQRCQSLQVDENLVRYKVSQTNKSLNEENQNIYDLQQFKLELEMAQREREIEVATHKEILAARQKNLDEAKARLKADVKQRKKLIEQFKQKFNSLLDVMGKNDEDEQCLSIVRFTVRNAQEKHLLQEQGDELDCKIQTAEREIIAIENTLKMVNETNKVFKSNLITINTGSTQ